MGKTQGESLDEYFDALAAVASMDQNVLAELVANVTKLTAANATLNSPRPMLHYLRRCRRLVRAVDMKMPTLGPRSFVLIARD